VGPSEFFTVMAAVDLLAGGEESLESIRSKVLERQRSVLDEFLAGIARLNRRGWLGNGELSEHAPDETRDIADISSCCADLMRTGGADPEVAKRWARMLVTLADRIPKRIKRNDLLVDTLSVLAEVLRREGHLETAKDILAEAQKRLPTSWDLMPQVAYWHRCGLLCRDLGQHGEALTAFGKAAVLAREQGWVEAEGEALVRQAEVQLGIEYSLNLCDDLGAVRTYRAALALEKRGLSPPVSLLASHGLAMALEWLGREQEALEVLSAARQRHEEESGTPAYFALLEFEGELLGR